MIQLKDKINKSLALRTIRRDAEKMYKESWSPELQIEAYAKGAEAILNYLQIPRVVFSEERAEVCEHEWDFDLKNSVRICKKCNARYLC